jgi:uncharacterized protein (DUF488 family)
MIVYTIGHSTRSVADLAAVVKAHGVEQIVDIRSIRRSRANPQFNEASVGRALARRGVGYRVNAALGGRRGKPKRPPRLPNDAWTNAAFRNYADYAASTDFRAGLAELLRTARRTPTAIMCAEAVWWRCHRRIVADHLIARGIEVHHIMSPTSAPEATLTPFAKIVRGRVHYPKR